MHYLRRFSFREPTGSFQILDRRSITYGGCSDGSDGEDVVGRWAGAIHVHGKGRRKLVTLRYELERMAEVCGGCA